MSFDAAPNYALPPESIFPLGISAFTPLAVNVVGYDQCCTLLHRHARGDWGDVSAEVILANELAVKEGGQIRSCYRLADATQAMVFTFALPSGGIATLVTLPDEYTFLSLTR